ncbi:DUF1707 and DUF4190 domain-containing protein [Kitasatospora sp. NPDC047058]|uniref:DUF1707 and DUF4190 domain-containing protein n=1 Tax=Kitasatospora sp. NPDC047058 TaxID=3155620 RepID=UPI0033F571C9
MGGQPWGEQDPGFGGRSPQASPAPYNKPWPAASPSFAPQSFGPQPSGQLHQSQMRAAHTDRDRTVDVLKAAFAEGRLTADEYGQRFDAASAAQTYGELARLVADLPSGPMVTPMVTPMTAAGPPVPQTFLPPPVLLPPPRPTNGAAVASLVLSLFGLGLPAVIAGHVAKNQLRTRKEDGDAMATVGLVIGYVECAIFGLFVLILLLASGGPA